MEPTVTASATPAAPPALRAVPVARPPRRGVVGVVVNGIASLLKGMRVTFGYLVRPSTVVTRQYPENRATLKLPERARTILSFIYDENGYHKCTACRSCETACPNGSIKITSRKGAVTGRNEIDRFTWRLDTCTFCNMCVVVCPFDALTMSGSFEASVYDRRLFVYNLNRYAGPPASALAKIEDAGERAKLLEPREPFSGAVPMCGTALAGVPPLVPEAGTGAAPDSDKAVTP